MSTFWSQMAQEPKRQHRWYVDFTANTGELQSLRFAAKKVTKPSSKIGSVQHKYLNHFYNFPGRLEWNDITIDFASVANTSNNLDGTTIVEYITRVAGYNLPMNELQIQTISKQKFEIGIGNIVITQIDAEGNPNEQWTLYRPFFTDIKYGDLDYSNEDIVSISVTVKYDWASLNGNRGTGQPVNT